MLEKSMAAIFIVFMALIFFLLLRWRLKLRRRMNSLYSELFADERISTSRDQLIRYNLEGPFTELAAERWILQRSIFWHEPCLDATCYALDSLKLLDELNKMQKTSSSFLSDYLARHGSALHDFVLQHYDDQLAGFRYALPVEDASLYGTHCAARVISHMQKTINGNSNNQLPSWDNLIEFVGKERAEKTKQFIFDCRVDGKGYCENPYFKAEPTVADTDIAVRLLRAFGFGESVPKGIADEMWHNFKVESEKYGLAFSNLENDTVGYNCATYFALRICNESNGKLAPDTADELLKFIRFCKGPEGAFGPKPGKPSSVAYSHLSLHGIRKYIRQGTRWDRQCDIIDPDLLVKFIKKCFYKGGYIIETSMVHPPEILSSRAALRMIAELKSHGLDDLDLRQFRLEETADYILSHLCTDAGTFRGY